MDPELVMQWARDQITRGADPAQVNAVIAERTEFSDIGALGQAVAGEFQAEADEFAQDAAEMTEIADNPVRSFAGSAAQGATFGFADEMVGLVNKQAGERLRGAQEARQEHAPGADLAAGAAGGFTPSVPLGVGARMLGRAGVGVRGLNMFAPGATRAGFTQGLLSGAARGGYTGAAAGAATGAGFAPPGERLEGAARGAGIGGTAGAVLTAPFGAAMGLMASRAGRAGRVADQLVEATDVPTVDRNVLRGRYQGAKQRIREMFYEPLEAAGAESASPQLSQTVAEIGEDPLVGNIIDPDVRTRIAPMAQGESLPAGETITFAEAQRLRSNLKDVAFDFQNTSVGVRNRARQVAKDLDEAMQDAFGDEGLRVADGAWNIISDRERAFENGIEMYNARSEEIQGVLAEMDAPARQAFNQGRLTEIVADLGTRYETAVPLLERMMDAGPETLTSIRRLFDHLPEEQADAAFQSFRRVLRSEAEQAKIAEGLRRILQSSAVGLFSGAVAGGVAGSLVGNRGEGN